MSENCHINENEGMEYCIEDEQTEAEHYIAFAKQSAREWLALTDAIDILEKHIEFNKESIEEESLN